MTDLLDLAKLDAGKMAPRYAKLDLARLASFAVSCFESLAREKNIDFPVDKPETLPCCATPITTGPPSFTNTSTP